MSKFKIGDHGIFTDGVKKYPARIIADYSLHKFVVGYAANGKEDVYLVDKVDGRSDRSIWRFEAEVKEEKFISYLFADGTATAFKPEGINVDLTKPYVAVVRAVKKDGKFTGHTLSRVDQTEEEFAQETKTEAPSASMGASFNVSDKFTDGDILDALEKLFGKGKVFKF